MPTPELATQPIITACTPDILLETSNKTSTVIKFTTSKRWNIILNDSKSQVSWVSLDNTVGEAGIIEVTATITEPNPSSINKRESYIKIVSDTAFRVVSIVQPPRPSTDVAVTNVSLDKKELNLVVGTNETLIATVNPTNATNQALEWSSSNPSVATVTQTGVISGIRNGMAIITATTVDTDKIATCKITVVTTPESGGQINDWD